MLCHEYFVADEYLSEIRFILEVEALILIEYTDCNVFGC